MSRISQVLKDNNLISSIKEFERLVKQGGVYINNERIISHLQEMPQEDCFIRVGKRKIYPFIDGVYSPPKPKEIVIELEESKQHSNLMIEISCSGQAIHYVDLQNKMRPIINNFLEKHQQELREMLENNNLKPTMIRCKSNIDPA